MSSEEINEQYEHYCKVDKDLKGSHTLPNYHYKLMAPERMIVKLEIFIAHFHKKKEYQKLNRCKSILMELRTNEIINLRQNTD